MYGQKKLRSLIATQFCGALNDNLFQSLLLFHLISYYGDQRAAWISGWLGIIFVVPFIIFSSTAGGLADRLPRAAIMRRLKAVEIGVMAVGVVGFSSNSPLLLLGTLFVMCSQSAFFGPAKYGSIGDLVSKQNLGRANGLISMSTYAASICGVFIASICYYCFPESPAQIALLTLLIAVAGYRAARTIPQLHNPVADTSGTPVTLNPVATLRSLAATPHLLPAIAGSIFFSFIAVLLKLNLIPYALHDLKLSQEQGGFLFFTTALGIGLGSYVAGRICRGGIELGLVAPAALLLGGGFAVLAVADPGVVTVGLTLFVMGAAGGCYLVPLSASVQFHAPDERRGAILGVWNSLSFSAMLGSSALVAFGEAVGLGAAVLFGFAALSCVMMGVVALYVTRRQLLRFILAIGFRAKYSILTHGTIPQSGGALIVANHISWIDGLVVAVSQKRRIRFMMERSIFNWWWCGWFFRIMGCIPVSTTDSPKRIVESIRQAKKALQSGEMVCIFAEGMISRTGLMNNFRSGFEHMVRKTGASIIPLHLGGIWGSRFSYYRDGKSPLHRRVIELNFGAAMDQYAKAPEVQKSVVRLSGNYYGAVGKGRTLAASFIARARKNWSHKAVADSSGMRLSHGRLAISSSLVAKRLPGTGPVGIFLPTGCAAAVSVVATALAGRTSVNLNYTAGEQTLAHAIDEAACSTIITARAFEKRGYELPAQFKDRALYIEDLSAAAKAAPLWEKLSTALALRALPLSWVTPQVASTECAAILFSSGSSSLPKGIQLSHNNITALSASIAQVFKNREGDDIASALPLFHSFGFSVSLWYPLLHGFSASYHTNPMDAKTVVKSVAKNGSTILLGTPTFLAAYARKASAEDFATLRMVISGAEKLRPAVSDLYRDKFELNILEGYGATELSPCASINVDTVGSQKGSKLGSVGKAMPGITARIIDPDSGEECDVGVEGELCIAGPTVMMGYLNNPAATATALRDGLYHTGDIAQLDKRGFITIVDRLSRFAKIGGEMVPHRALEDELATHFSLDAPALAVSSLPDAKRGERLVLLYDTAQIAGDALWQRVEESALPNLWKPRREDLLAVDAIPLLGTGKVDLKGVKAIAAANAANATKREVKNEVAA